MLITIPLLILVAVLASGAARVVAAIAAVLLVAYATTFLFVLDHEERAGHVHLDVGPT